LLKNGKVQFLREGHFARNRIHSVQENRREPELLLEKMLGKPFYEEEPQELQVGFGRLNQAHLKPTSAKIFF